MKTTWLAIGLVVTTWVVPVRARACGCFTMPSPANPVVQAGERILFAHDGNDIVAYIQISYQGSADQFGWLVPLPSVPQLQLGTDELFTKLGAATQPQYQLTTDQHFCGGGERVSTSSSSGIGCGAGEDTAFSASPVADLGIAASDGAARMDNEVVIKSSIGPYDYAVLKADDQTEMLKWLADQRYFVPDGTGDAVKPYIHAGGYFLAIKLRAGENSGDIVPVIVRYPSDLPMIPITLTQVGAVQNMGVFVWVLGEARAVPRNYYHTVLDELPVWFNSGPYSDLVARATREVAGHHTFLTEYAGGSSVMSQRLYSPGRFGDSTQLESITDPSRYISYLASHGFTFDSTLYGVLERYLPEPAELVQDGVDEQSFYGNYDSFAAGGGFGDGGPSVFDPVAMTNELQTRIVGPTIATQALFDHNPYLTRLYTTLSPADMNLDPVFSENPDLPSVDLIHRATLSIPCQGQPWLSTDGGFEVQYVSGLPPSYTLPASRRIERLREAGDPEVVIDNDADIRAQLGPVDHGMDTAASNSSSSSSSGSSPPGCACDVHASTRNRAETAVLITLAVLLARRRRWA